MTHDNRPGDSARHSKEYVLTVTLNAAIDTTLTVPSVTLGASYTAQDVLKLPGGKGLNVARTLNRLGYPVWATGLVGGAPTRFITGGLDADGIVPHFVPISGITRTCTAVVEIDHNRVTEVNEPGPEITADEAADFLAAFGDLIVEARAVAISGSLPPGLPDDYYALLLEQAHAAAVPAILDTSGRALGPGIAARPLLVKPNATEAAAIAGAPVESAQEAVAAGWALRERGAQNVALTLGARGAVLITGAGAWLASSPPIRPVSTVGSGDAFTGGCIAALCAAVDAGESPTLDAALADPQIAPRALAMAVACGSANALTLGAGNLDPETVKRLRDAVTVQRLA